MCEHAMNGDTKLFIIRAPRIFSLVWKGIKPLLDLHNAIVRDCLRTHRGYEVGR